MGVSTEASDLPMVGQPVERSISRSSRKLFLLWTAFWWGGVGACAFLFYFEVLDFIWSTKISLYGIAVLGCGEPVAATFIFSFAEVFAGFENMVGGVADILLALVWTQYQYFVFPLIFGVLGYRLLMDDWRQCHVATKQTNQTPVDALLTALPSS